MPKREKQQPKSSAARIRNRTQSSVTREPPSPSKIRTPAAARCDDCRATTAFQAWQHVDLPPSFNVNVSFASWNIVPKGKRAVIELVTAQAAIPSGEWVRLTMNTSLGSVPSNFDLVFSFQGNVGDKAFYVATHSLRAYTDNEIAFTIHRDNATTTGSALICVSGYVAG